MGAQTADMPADQADYRAIGGKGWQGKKVTKVTQWADS
jgi:hypothetical protein